MNVAHMIKGNFINGEKLSTAGPQEVTVVNGEIISLGEDEKVVLSFAETEKQLALNKTRLSFMIGNFGEDTDEWKDKKILLHAQQLTSGKFAGQYTILISKPIQVPMGSLVKSSPQVPQINQTEDENPFFDKPIQVSPINQTEDEILF